jgi:hypothetical protein
VIADVANRHAFWHMGQFAKYYKTMFGELPSETLKLNRIWYTGFFEKPIRKVRLELSILRKPA